MAARDILPGNRKHAYRTDRERAEKDPRLSRCFHRWVDELAQVRVAYRGRAKAVLGVLLNKFGGAVRMLRNLTNMCARVFGWSARATRRYLTVLEEIGAVYLCRAHFDNWTLIIKVNGLLDDENEDEDEPP